MHVWMADTATAKERQAWIAQLDEMKALKPTKVIAETHECRHAYRCERH